MLAEHVEGFASQRQAFLVISGDAHSKHASLARPTSKLTASGAIGLPNDDSILHPGLVQKSGKIALIERIDALASIELKNVVELDRKRNRPV